MEKFTLGDFEISAQLIDNNPWFVGRDIARSLGYIDTVKALSRHVETEDKVTKDVIRGRNALGLKSKVIMINESGLYSLILRSKLEKAKEFKRWVIHDVLPSIRRTGGYKLPKKSKWNAVITIVDERNLHHHVVDYIRRFHPYALPFMIAGLGELQRTKSLRIECWKKGYQRGQPDIIINLPQNRVGFSKKGLVIELKTPLGSGIRKLSPDQERVLDKYNSVGYGIIVSFDFVVLIKLIDNYMSGVLPHDCGRCNRSFRSEDSLSNHESGFHKVRQSQ